MNFKVICGDKVDVVSLPIDSLAGKGIWHFYDAIRTIYPENDDLVWNAHNLHEYLKLFNSNHLYKIKFTGVYNPKLSKPITQAYVLSEDARPFEDLEDVKKCSQWPIGLVEASTKTNCNYYFDNIITYRWYAVDQNECFMKYSELLEDEGLIEPNLIKYKSDWFKLKKRNIWEING